MLEELEEIYHSERWKDQDNPIRKHIPELYERIDHPNKYKELRENKNLKLLVGIIEALEESFNDDWLPFEFFGLELDDVKLFIKDLLEKLPKSDEKSVPQIIEQSHKTMMEKIITKRSR